MVRFFLRAFLSILLFPTIAFAQNLAKSDLNEGMILEYVFETHAVYESLSADSYKEWINVYLNDKSELEIIKTVNSTGKKPATTISKLNQEQYYKMVSDKLKWAQSYKISNSKIDSIKISKKGRSAIIIRTHNFDQSIQKTTVPVTSSGIMKCQELLLINHWTNKVTMAKSLCEIMITIKEPDDKY